MTNSLDTTNNSNDFTFKVKTGEEYSLVINQENHQPIKLGDGTFGIVFRVQKKDNIGTYRAVKVLYDIGASEDRYKAEVKANELIYQGIDKDSDNTVGIIKNYGYTDEFIKSPAGNFLKGLGLRISNYALVMEEFECTLKDLLEKKLEKFTIKSLGKVQNILPLPSFRKLLKPTETKEEKEAQVDDIFTEDNQDKQKIFLKQSIYELRGYDILERMNFTERMNEILPYLENIASGLRFLHECNWLHFDLKPANIFVKKMSDGSIKTVIGDLGYLSNSAANEANFSRNSDSLVTDSKQPKGTRHYRSPEQKDYFDIADVEVKIEQHKSVKLIINDKKFKDSIIEKNDLVYFSKNPTTYYVIKDIKLIDNNSFEVELNINDNVDLSNDKNTQVIFVKKISYRTDIFGFGAIFFDLITCGSSPEHFYAKVRNYDYADNTISKIKQAYESLYNYQSDEPGLEQIFAPFKQHNTSKIYASPKIVEFILKCILYKAQDTFFDINRKQNNAESDNSIMKKVFDEIFKFKEFQSDRDNLYVPRNTVLKSLENRNRLYLGELDEKESKTLLPFEEQIEEIQSYSKTQIPLRFFQSIHILKQLGELVLNQIVQHNFGFAELQPRNIIAPDDLSGYEKQLRIKFQTYDDKSVYKHDLKMDFVHTKIITDLKNTYVPDYLAFMRRSIDIIIENIKYIQPQEIQNDNFSEDESNPNSPNMKYLNLECKYFFLDSSPYRDNININDWLVYKPQASEENKLFFIKEINREKQTITLISDIPFELREEADTIFEKNIIYRNFIFYKNLHPINYYLQIVGLYVYNLFFVGIDGNSKDKPIIANILREYSKDIEQLVNVDLKNLPRTPYQFFGKNSKLHNKFYDVINSLVIFYLKLTFENSKNSYLSQVEKSPKQTIEGVLEEIKEILDKVVRFLKEYLQFVKNDHDINTSQIERLDLETIDVLKEMHNQDPSVIEDCGIHLGFSKLIVSNCLVLNLNRSIN